VRHLSLGVRSEFLTDGAKSVEQHVFGRICGIWGDRPMTWHSQGGKLIAASPGLPKRETAGAPAASKQHSIPWRELETSNLMIAEAGFMETPACS
jgi:hypothetical protein